MPPLVARRAIRGSDGPSAHEGVPDRLSLAQIASCGRARWHVMLRNRCSLHASVATEGTRIHAEFGDREGSCQIGQRELGTSVPRQERRRRSLRLGCGRPVPVVKSANLGYGYGSESRRVHRPASDMGVSRTLSLSIRAAGVRWCLTLRSFASGQTPLAPADGKPRISRHVQWRRAS